MEDGISSEKAGEWENVVVRSERNRKEKKQKGFWCNGFLGFSFNFWEYALAHLITHFIGVNSVGRTQDHPS